MDFSPIVSSVDFSGASITMLAIGAALVVALAIEWGVHRVLALMGGSEQGIPHDQAFYSEGEARTGMDAVYERAAAMAAAGEGQSEDYRHNTITEAYDAGYSGRYLGDTLDPATSAAWNQARADRAEDNAKGW